MIDSTCRHSGCTCEAREDGYCSDFCAERGSENDAGQCRCGHVRCEADHEAGAASG